MWPDDETSEPAAWINFNAATGERNVSFVCESELASIPLWPEPQPQRKPLTEEDACLIAAAPDLLEALQGLLRGIFDGPDEANAAMLVAKARDAVNKATGEK